jgi:hypothetical protein
MMRPLALYVDLQFFLKALANRIAPKMDSLTAVNQSAFIKGRSIHHTFMLVNQYAKNISSKESPNSVLET